MATVVKVYAGNVDYLAKNSSAAVANLRATENYNLFETLHQIADGETIEEAIGEARDAFDAWMVAEQDDKGELPTPKRYSGQFVSRIPKSLHQQLARRAESEGVSLNQLATTFLAQGLARRG